MAADEHRSTRIRAKKHMKQIKFPEEWDEARVAEALAFYERQTEEEAVAEDEESLASSETVMTVPHELVPQVRQLIAERAKRRS